MLSGRRVFYSHDCETSVQRLGGWRLLDRVLEPILDGLERNPYGFPRYECDWFSVRYVVTKPLETVPALVWYFVIEGQDITVTDVEEHDGY